MPCFLVLDFIGIIYIILIYSVFWKLFLFNGLCPFVPFRSCLQNRTFFLKTGKTIMMLQVRLQGSSQGGRFVSAKVDIDRFNHALFFHRDCCCGQEPQQAVAGN